MSAREHLFSAVFFGFVLWPAFGSGSIRVSHVVPPSNVNAVGS